MAHHIKAVDAKRRMIIDLSGHVQCGNSDHLTLPVMLTFIISHSATHDVIDNVHGKRMVSL